MLSWALRACGPERIVTSAPVSSGVYIHDGMIYWLRRDASGSSVCEQAIGSDRERVVARETGAIFDLDFTSRLLMYRFLPHQSDTTPKSAGATTPVQLLGVFRAAPDPMRTWHGLPVRRTPAPRGLGAPTGPTRVRAITAPGGAAFSLPAGGLYPIAAAGDALCWVEMRWDDTAYVTAGVGTWAEVAGHSAVWCTVPGRSVPRRLRTGVPMFTQLMGTGDGVFWTEPRDFPDRSVDLCYSLRQGPVRVLMDYRGPDRYSPPVVCGQRMCWIACRATDGGAGGGAQEWSADCLVSADLDGGSQRIEVSFADCGCTPEPWGLRSRQYLYVHRGKLLCVAREGQAAGQADGALRLTQIPVGDRAPMRGLTDLPPDARDFAFDGDYLYFTRAQQLGDTGGQAWSLYRIRLPD